METGQVIGRLTEMTAMLLPSRLCRNPKRQMVHRITLDQIRKLG
jgi:hypothetical protein